MERSATPIAEIQLVANYEGQTHDIVIGPEAPEDHVVQKYTNTIVGRYANRIPVGTHPLERNAFKSELTTYANGTGVALFCLIYQSFILISGFRGPESVIAWRTRRLRSPRMDSVACG